MNTRRGSVPAVSDLRDSGQIEPEASAIVLMRREDYYEPESEQAGEVHLIVGKNRTQRVHLHHHRGAPTALRADPGHGAAVTAPRCLWVSARERRRRYRSVSGLWDPGSIRLTTPWGACGEP
ncbi:DnaB-like helicase C-terminal domain-containing protein [Streptomyces sp. NPDC056121]|uniref:DnaB-like helicase C-terminal domain-containing protein n=1 Tax=Streptomyces sp. NPDC056121 TaxID=3345718 RepID=UPI0035DDC37F